MRLLHYYHNLWWERNRSSIRSVGKVTTAGLFEQRPRGGHLGVFSVCLVINHSGFEESERRHGLYPPSSSLAAGGLRTPSDHGSEAKVSLSRSHPSLTQPPSSPHIPPAASPLFTCCPGDHPPCERRQRSEQELKQQLIPQKSRDTVVRTDSDGNVTSDWRKATDLIPKRGAE